jgi:xylulokinase
MPAPVLIGIDIGTSAIKVIAFDRGGGTIAEASGGYAVSRPAADRSEADPEVVWARVGELCRACLVNARAAGRGEVAAVGVSGLLGYLGLDAAGRPITPAVLWNDRRGAVLCDELRSRLDAGAVFEWAGRPLAPERTICLLLWWRRNQPRLFARMRWVVSVKDYVAWRLTGSLATDWLHAGYTLLFDVRARRWRVDLAERLELPASLLPPARSPGDGLGAVTAAAGEATGLAVGTPVAVGGIDGSLGAIGGGAVDATVCVDVAGTTDSVFAVAERAEIAADSGLVRGRQRAGAELPRGARPLACRRSDDDDRRGVGVAGSAAGAAGRGERGTPGAAGRGGTGAAGRRGPGPVPELRG